MRIKSKGAVVALAAWFILLGHAELTSAQAKSVFAQCANQVGATYMGEGRWRLSGSGRGLAQEQNFYNCIDSYTEGQRSSSRPAVSQKSAGVKRRAAQSKPKRRVEEVREKEAFSGSESRIAAMNFVNADCSPGPLPEVRIVTPPSSGDVRMEPIKLAVSRDKSNARAHCNGKIVDAVAVFYKSKSDFAGADKVVLDVDFKAGTVKRYIYAINIR
jgi:hypothetical protein